MGADLQNGDIIARRMGDGQFRLARYMNGADSPMTAEPAFDQCHAEVRARVIAKAEQCRAWIEEPDGQIRRLA